MPDYFIPKFTNWAQIAKELQPGQAVWVPTAERARSLEERLRGMRRWYARGRMADLNYLVWHLGRAGGAPLAICGHCLEGRHEECAAGGQSLAGGVNFVAMSEPCDCLHQKPVIPGVVVRGPGRPGAFANSPKYGMEREENRWTLLAERMKPGDALLLKGATRARALELAIKDLPAYSRKFCSGGLYVVWHLGAMLKDGLRGWPLKVCRGCELRQCFQSETTTRGCLKGEVKGWRAPIECDCQHGPVLQIEPGEPLALPAGAAVERRGMTSEQLRAMHQERKRRRAELMNSAHGDNSNDRVN